MPSKTTMTVEKDSLKMIHKKQAEIITKLEGRKITRDQAIEALCLGYKNPDFNESEFFELEGVNA